MVISPISSATSVSLVQKAAPAPAPAPAPTPAPTPANDGDADDGGASAAPISSNFAAALTELKIGG